MTAEQIGLIALAISVLSVAGQVANVVMKLSIDNKIKDLKDTLKDDVQKGYVAVSTCAANHKGQEATCKATHEGLRAELDAVMGR